MEDCKIHVVTKWYMLRLTDRAIVDGRLGFKIMAGFTITLGFATKEELKVWAKMKLPKAQELIEKVAEMESATMGTNFEFRNEGNVNVQPG